MTAAERRKWADEETANLLGRVTAGADLEQQIAEALYKAATPEPMTFAAGPMPPSALLEAVQAWQRLVDQLAPYAEKNDDPADVLGRLVCELTELRARRDG